MATTVISISYVDGLPTATVTFVGISTGIHPDPNNNNNVITDYKTLSIITETSTSSAPQTSAGSTTSSTASTRRTSTTASPTSSSSTTTNPSTTGSSTSPASTQGAGKTSTKGSSISPGVVAGSTIGGLVIGFLIAALLAFLYMKRSRRHRSTGGSRRYSRDYEEKPAATNGLEETQTLLDRADDSQLRKSAQDLAELIDQHVENHYHLQPLPTPQSQLETHLIEAGYTSEPSVAEMVALLRDPRTRFVAIRELIARILVGNLEWRGGELSLLPSGIASFLSSIPPVERAVGAQDVFDKALSKWRHLSAFLLQPSRSTREAPIPIQQDLQPVIARNLAVINKILKPFIDLNPDNQRSQERNLSAILFEGAQLGLLLFSQPSIWVWGWKIGSGEGGGVRRRTFVVFPSLGERVERHGRDRVREVVVPVVVDL